MNHPIADEFLVDYAVGAAPEPLEVLVAAHAALNPESRATLAQLEAAGGALLETVVPAPIDDRSLAAVLSRLGVQERSVTTREDGVLPAAVRPYLPDGLAAAPWRQLGFGLRRAKLPTHDADYTLSLLSIGAGRAFPHHAHRDLEFLLVLDGSFTDESGHYRRGDVCVSDAEHAHRPVADAEKDCLCLAVTTAPIRFTGLLALLNPFVRD